MAFWNRGKGAKRGSANDHGEHAPEQANVQANGQAMAGQNRQTVHRAVGQDVSLSSRWGAAVGSPAGVQNNAPNVVNRRFEPPTAAQAAMTMTENGSSHEPSTSRNSLRTEPDAPFEASVLADQEPQAQGPVGAQARTAEGAAAAAVAAEPAPEAEKPDFKAGKNLAKDVEGTYGCDWWLFVLVIMLLGVGLVMVLSASGIMAESNYGDKYFFFRRQLIFAFAGGICMAVAAILPRNFLYRLHYPLLGVVLVLVLLTLSPLSPSINGAHRWIPLGPVNVQPMEFVKIALALYLAFYMSEKQELVKTFTRGVIPPAIVTGTFCFLLLLQPDFGSAVVLALMLLLMCIAGGTRVIYVLTAAVLGIVAIGALAVLEPYRMRRLMAFLDPFKDAHDTGYQLVQSLLAIGSGSFFGVGMGASRQKMFYLPEAHNDFIMAVLAEEMGFVGVSVVMLLFLMFFRRCYLIIKGQDELRARYTAFALTLVIGLGFILNLAVVMGAAPPKGVPMPFLSYGGSNLLAMMICVGLLLNFSRTAKMPH